VAAMDGKRVSCGGVRPHDEAAYGLWMWRSRWNIWLPYLLIYSYAYRLFFV